MHRYGDWTQSRSSRKRVIASNMACAASSKYLASALKTETLLDSYHATSWPSLAPVPKLQCMPGQRSSLRSTLACTRPCYGLCHFDWRHRCIGPCISNLFRCSGNLQLITTDDNEEGHLLSLDIFIACLMEGALSLSRNIPLLSFQGLLQSRIVCVIDDGLRTDWKSH
jgi:hypothetical protein